MPFEDDISFDPKFKISNANPYGVPEGYFDELEGNIESRIAIGDDTSQKLPFNTEEEYFSTLEDKIMSGIYINEAALSSSPFEVPEDYFETLPDKIESRIAIGEDAMNKIPFEVPKDYFEKLEAKIAAKVAIASEKAIPLRNVRFINYSILAMASAACIIIVSGIFIVKNYFNTKPMSFHYNSTQEVLSSLDKKEMSEVLLEFTNEDMDEDMIITAVDESKVNTAGKKIEDDILMEDIDETTLTEEL